jgi:hypothetical protein
MRQAVERRASWTERERRRDARGRSRNLTAILRRARLSRAQRRSRGIARRRELAGHAERQRARAQVAESLELLSDLAWSPRTLPPGADEAGGTAIQSSTSFRTTSMPAFRAAWRRPRPRPNLAARSSAASQPAADACGCFHVWVCFEHRQSGLQGGGVSHGSATVMEGHGVGVFSMGWVSSMGCKRNSGRAPRERLSVGSRALSARHPRAQP